MLPKCQEAVSSRQEVVSEAGFDLKFEFQFASSKCGNPGMKWHFFHCVYFFSMIFLFYDFLNSKIPTRVQIQMPKQVEKQLNSKPVTNKLQPNHCQASKSPNQSLPSFKISKIRYSLVEIGVVVEFHFSLDFSDNINFYGSSIQ